MKTYDIIIIGGGASGFFTAINTAQNFPQLKIAILERGKDVLGKVKISGGGRCNVTHAEFIPKDLTYNYPRGEKELLGPFHTFMTGDTMSWFEERGVALKIEEDGRIFPESNTSQTIIDCFISEAEKFNVDILTNQSVTLFSQVADGWQVSTKTDEFSCNKLVMATGSNPKIWNLLKTQGYQIVPPVPSLFTFNCDDVRIKNIPGVVAQDVQVEVLGTNLSSSGPLLFTHWGFSAPSILKLSAYGALELAAVKYKFNIKINFINQTYLQTLNQLMSFKHELGKKTILKFAQFELPKRLWKTLVLHAEIGELVTWADVNKAALEALAQQLTSAVFQINGKSTFKEEFVTAGGIDLKEVNFKTFESKQHKNLYFAGEILNIDGVTGGFNFQNAWTSGFIIAKQLGE
ncbi:BaiN/RdsA family NAD(P)/FAD-dependent oxidoreductase [Aurantibacter aestuarii]|uniref:Aminoacetone oxidase family FAD-binding enzyme n=1 Tax=Aurantibacter aestuarii TaxID=1266046 RepID=A0A2T1NDZ0_9FLAO|nr:NAD(P)/FAD-dependent oxidoreductase [Aurantibacter aestuarii]PSG90663.1 aminoacetone oxidase family FAD-binding enzyme [Aurantibacter aestuarii]